MLRFWLGGGCCYGSGFAPPPVVRTQPGNRGLFRGLNIHTPPPVGGVYRLRATPTRRRGTDTRYQRTLVAPTSVERRRSVVSLPPFYPSTAAIFHVLIFPPPPSLSAACVCPLSAELIHYFAANVIINNYAHKIGDMHAERPESVCYNSYGTADNVYHKSNIFVAFIILGRPISNIKGSLLFFNLK